jgi:ribosomal protein L16 Arg81 hydroxylase
MKNTDFHFHVWSIGASNSFKEIENIYPEFSQLLNLFKKLLKDDEIFIVKSSINFVGGTPEEYTGVPHIDSLNVFSFQTIGSVKYNIYKKDNDKEYPKNSIINVDGLEKTTFLIEKNDLFFIPNGIIHQVEVFEPRATLILDVEN